MPMGAMGASGVFCVPQARKPGVSWPEGITGASTCYRFALNS